MLCWVVKIKLWLNTKQHGDYAVREQTFKFHALVGSFAFQTLAQDYSNVIQSESQQHLSLYLKPQCTTTTKNCKLTPQHLLCAAAAETGHKAGQGL